VDDHGGVAGAALAGLGPGPNEVDVGRGPLGALGDDDVEDDIDGAGVEVGERTEQGAAGMVEALCLQVNGPQRARDATTTDGVLQGAQVGELDEGQAGSGSFASGTRRRTKKLSPRWGRSLEEASGAARSWRNSALRRGSRATGSPLTRARIAASTWASVHGASAFWTSGMLRNGGSSAGLPATTSRVFHWLATASASAAWASEGSDNALTTCEK